MNDLSVPDLPVIHFAEVCAGGTLSEESKVAILHDRVALGDLMIVADGIGEYSGGEVASRMAVDHLYAYLAALPPDYPADDALRGAAARANASIMMAASAPGSPHERMGSSVVIALVRQEGDLIYTWLGHIGNNRAYLLRADRLHRITTDHSAAQALLNRSLITPEEALSHPDTSVPTRGLGLQPHVEIDIEQLPLAVGDTLLLCSYGLWGFVPEQDIQAAAAADTVDNAASILLEQALSAGNQETVGIEIVRLSPPDPIAPQSKHPYAAAKWIVALFVAVIVSLCILGYFALWYE